MRCVSKGRWRVMRAISLWPEWAWAVMHLDKRIENRSWTRPNMTGRFVAIHATKYVGGAPGAVAERRGIETMVRSAIGAGWWAGLSQPGDTSLMALFKKGDEEVQVDARYLERSAIVGVAQLERFAFGTKPAPWGEVDAWWWHFAQVRRFATPIPMSGRQGLWPLPPDVDALVRDLMQPELELIEGGLQ